MKEVQILEMKVVKQTGGIGIGTPDGILTASISISYTKKNNIHLQFEKQRIS